MKTPTRQLTHRCRYCGHEGAARGKAAELDHERVSAGTIRAAYSCKDVAACGERIRAARPDEWKCDGLPF